MAKRQRFGCLETWPYSGKQIPTLRSPIVRKPRKRLCDARNISAWHRWNVPTIAQPYTKLILVLIFYCRTKKSLRNAGFKGKGFTVAPSRVLFLSKNDTALWFNLYKFIFFRSTIRQLQKWKGPNWNGCYSWTNSNSFQRIWFGRTWIPKGSWCYEKVKNTQHLLIFS